MLNRRKFSLALASAPGLCLTSSALSAEADSDWSSWRGNQRDGVCPGADWPKDLRNLTRQWSIDLSDSYSGPIIADGRVFTTESIGNQFESLVALDHSTGQELWRKQWSGAMTVPFFAKANGDWIRSTPATDGKRVLVCGMRDVIASFDAATGDEQWRVDFIADHGAVLPSFGLVCSPLIQGGFAYVQAGGAVRKVNLEDGSLVWSSMADQGGMSGGAFSSPILAPIHGVEQLIAQTRTTLCGLDLETGEPLWQRDIAAFRGMNILTPTLWNNHVFTSAYGGKAQLLNIIPGDTWSTEVAWEAKAEAYMSSPLIVDDHLYLHLRNQRFSCLDLATGKEKWRTTPFGKYWSMVTDRESILALDETGDLRLIRANPDKFELLDSQPVSSEPSWAHIALAGEQIFIRRQRGLDAYRWA